MTELEKAQLAELAERAWRSVPNGIEDFHAETIKASSNEITIVHLSEGLSLVRNRELLHTLRQWYLSVEELQSTKRKKNPSLEDEIEKSFGLVKGGYFKIGDYLVLRKGNIEKVATFVIVLGVVISFIAGVLATALFNWIF